MSGKLNMDWKTSISPIIREKLFLSSVFAASNGRLLGKYRIQSILSFYPLHKKYRGIEYQEIRGVRDAEDENISQYFKFCCDWIKSRIQENRRVLVNCHVGKSRSSSIVIAYLIREHGMSFSQSLRLVQKKRPIAQPNRGFETQLKDFGYACYQSRLFRTDPRQGRLLGGHTEPWYKDGIDNKSPLILKGRHVCIGRIGLFAHSLTNNPVKGQHEDVLLNGINFSVVKKIKDTDERLTIFGLSNEHFVNCLHREEKDQPVGSTPAQSEAGSLDSEMEEVGMAVDREEEMRGHVKLKKEHEEKKKELEKENPKENYIRNEENKNVLPAVLTIYTHDKEKTNGIISDSIYDYFVIILFDRNKERPSPDKSIIGKGKARSSDLLSSPTEKGESATSDKFFGHLFQSIKELCCMWDFSKDVAIKEVRKLEKLAKDMDRSGHVIVEKKKKNNVKAFRDCLSECSKKLGKNREVIMLQHVTKHGFIVLSEKDINPVMKKNFPQFYGRNEDQSEGKTEVNKKEPSPGPLKNAAVVLVKNNPRFVEVKDIAASQSNDTSEQKKTVVDSPEPLPTKTTSSQSNDSEPKSGYKYVIDLSVVRLSLPEKCTLEDNNTIKISEYFDFLPPKLISIPKVSHVLSNEAEYRGLGHFGDWSKAGTKIGDEEPEIKFGDCKDELKKVWDYIVGEHVEKVKEGLLDVRKAVALDINQYIDTIIRNFHFVDTVKSRLVKGTVSGKIIRDVASLVIDNGYKEMFGSKKEPGLIAQYQMSVKKLLEKHEKQEEENEKKEEDEGEGEENEKQEEENEKKEERKKMFPNGVEFALKKYQIFYDRVLMLKETLYRVLSNPKDLVSSFFDEWVKKRNNDMKKSSLSDTGYVCQTKKANIEIHQKMDFKKQETGQAEEEEEEEPEDVVKIYKKIYKGVYSMFYRDWRNVVKLNRVNSFFSDFRDLLKTVREFLEHTNKNEDGKLEKLKKVSKIDFNVVNITNIFQRGFLEPVACVTFKNKKELKDHVESCFDCGLELLLEDDSFSFLSQKVCGDVLDPLIDDCKSYGWSAAVFEEDLEKKYCKKVEGEEKGEEKGFTEELLKVGKKILTEFVKSFRDDMDELLDAAIDRCTEEMKEEMEKLAKVPESTPEFLGNAVMKVGTCPGCSGMPVFSKEEEMVGLVCGFKGKDRNKWKDSGIVFFTEELLKGIRNVLREEEKKPLAQEKTQNQVMEKKKKEEPESDDIM